MNDHSIKEISILLVEDSIGDARLVMEAIKESKMRNTLHHVTDGEMAMQYMRKEGEFADATTPDLILLDLNMPRMDGREVLASLKNDDRFKKIPVVILTTSKSDEDIVRSYDLHANCYIAKPVDFDQFINVVQSINNFWFSIVSLPNHEH